jgi:hypothetical protein
VVEEFTLLLPYCLMQHQSRPRESNIWNISRFTEETWRYENLNVLIRDRAVKMVVQRSFRFRTSNVISLCPVKSTSTNRILPRQYAAIRPHNELLTCAMHEMISVSAFRPTGLVLSLTVHCCPYPNRRYTVPFKESRSRRLICNWLFFLYRCNEYLHSLCRPPGTVARYSCPSF